MATVRELVTKYGFDVNDKPLHDLQDTLASVSLKVAGVAASFAASAAAVFGIAAATAHAGDEAKATASKIGITTEALGRLQYAAKLSNLSAEGMNTALRFLSRNAYEAATGGGEVAQAFQKVGVSLRDGNGKLKTADRLTLELADKFKAMPDGIEKTALSLKIFGRSGSEIIPMLNEGTKGLQEMGDEAEQFGLIFTKDQAALSDQVNDNFDRIQEAFKGLTFTVGKELLPMMKNLTDSFIKLLKDNRAGIIKGISTAIKGLTQYVEFGWMAFKQLISTGKSFVQLFGGFENVVKIFGTLSAILASGTILYAIGAISVAAYGLAAAFTLADAAALAIPIGIGLAIAALALLIEDIVTFFTDGDSYFGDLLNVFEEKFPRAFNFLKSTLKEVFSSMGEELHTMWVTVKAIVDGIMYLGGAIGHAAGGLYDFFAGTVQPSSQVTNANQSSNRYDINAPITVTTGGNLTAGQAASSVRGGVGDGLDSILRGAGRSYQGGVAY